MATVAEFIVRQLAAWGTKHVYGVVGDTLFPLMDAIAQQQEIRFIAVRHEAAAGFMASAEAKLTGRLAVCIATSGPGITSLLNGLGDAYADRVPVLALTGQVERKKIGSDAKQYLAPGPYRPLDRPSAARNSGTPAAINASTNPPAPASQSPPLPRFQPKWAALTVTSPATAIIAQRSHTPGQRPPFMPPA